MVGNINNIKLEIISLFRINYLAGFHIRQMGGLIGRSHVSLLPHLKELEKDKILISKEVGKNKVFHLNLENNQVREFLSLAEKSKSIELLNKELFLKKLHEEFLILDLNGSLILFGSYASKTHTNQSDIDLFYLGDITETGSKKIKDLGKIYKKEIHLNAMTISQFREQLVKRNILIKEIINNHIILCNHDVFINEVWRYYYERRE